MSTPPPAKAAPAEMPPSRMGMAPPHVFFLLWLGQTLAFLGARVTSFAVGVALYQETGSVTRFTLIGLSIAIPTIVLSPLAGALADRFPRRLVLLGATIGAIFGTVAVHALVRAGLLSAWTMYATIAVKAAASAFIWPTFTAATTLLVEKQHFARASGLNQTGQALGRIIGPLLGGALLVSVSLENIVLVEVGALLLATLLLAVLRLPEPRDLAAREAATETGEDSTSTAAASGPRLAPGGAPAPVSPHRASEGWTFLERHRGLFQILLLFAALNFCVGILQVLLPPLILAFASPLVLGIVSAVASCGMFVGGVAVSLWGGPAPGQRVKAILAITAIEGVLLILGGAQADVTLIAVAAFFFLFSIPIIGGASQAIWQAKTPVELQGRVFAVRTMIAGGSIPLAMAVAGPLADFVFEPAMARGGALAGSLGGWIGVGEGRGIGLLIVCLGAALVVSTAFAFRSAPLRRLETEIPDAIGDDSGADERRAREAEKKGGPEPLLATGTLPALALTALLTSVALAAILAQDPPPARDADAPPTTFSAARALEHVRWIAREPHPTGSPANARVRDGLIATLEALGSADRRLMVTVQSAGVAVPSPMLPRLVEVENVVARLPGRVEAPANDPRATLLMAHYDSVIVSPGAADNGAAVAALIETARALLADEPLRHDVIFLFTDAEEFGLAGARAFLDHPWARDVAVLANFEARGHRGPVYMFETGDDNGFWIPHYLAAAPRPIASSLMNQVYRRLPNDTDFTVFRDAGYAGFNLAFIGGLTHYHGGLDTPEALDLRSLQHHGETALELARCFADLDLDATAPEQRRRADRVYFNVFGSTTVHYPRWLAALVSILAAASVLAATARGTRRGRLTAFGTGQGALAFLAALVAIPALLVLGWFGVRDLGNVPMVMGSTFAAPFYMAAFSAVTLTLFVLLMRLVRQLVAALDLAAGALLVSLLLLGLTSGVYLPVESHFLLAWPILGAGAALFWLVGRPSEIDEREKASGSWRTVGVLALGALPALLLLPPFVGPVYIGLQGLFELGGVPLVLEVFLLGLLLPQLEVLGLRRGVALWAVPLVVAAALLVPALAAPEPPEVDHVLYAVDLGEDDPEKEPEAHWFSIDRPPAERLHDLGLGPKLDGSESAPIHAFFPWARRPLPHAPAEVVSVAPLAATQAAGTPIAPEIVAVRTSDEGLEVDLELPAGAIARLLWIEPAGTGARVLWQGVEVTLGPPAPAGPGRVRSPILHQVPASAKPLTLVFADPVAPALEATEEVEIVIVDQYAGLPAGVPERPEGHAPRPSFEALSTDTSLVRHVLKLAGSGEPEPDKASEE